MKRYSEMKFADIVAVSDNLSAMVRCVENFPDFNVTPVGCVVQLSAPQAGYVTGHVYICALDPHGSKYWKDLTISTDISPATTGSFKVTKSYTGSRLNYVDMYWSTPATTEQDPWMQDVVMMQSKRSPFNTNDGLVCIGSVKANEYTSSHPYRLIANRTTDEYIFRVFHVFASGAMTYHDPT